MLSKKRWLMIFLKVISWKMKDKLNIFFEIFFYCKNKIVTKKIDEVLFDRADYRWLAKFMQKNFDLKYHGRSHSIDHDWW